VKSDPKGMIQMISNFDEEIKQSKISMELLSSEDFMNFSKKV